MKTEDFDNLTQSIKEAGAIRRAALLQKELDRLMTKNGWIGPMHQEVLDLFAKHIQKAIDARRQ